MIPLQRHGVAVIRAYECSLLRYVIRKITSAESTGICVESNKHISILKAVQDIQKLIGSEACALPSMSIPVLMAESFPRNAAQGFFGKRLIFVIHVSKSRARSRKRCIGPQKSVFWMLWNALDETWNIQKISTIHSSIVAKIYFKFLYPMYALYEYTNFK